MKSLNLGDNFEAFPTTNWECLGDLKDSEREVAQGLISHLSACYWGPVYSYLVSKGFADETAKDLTQDFFCEIVIKNDLFYRADQAKGHLRTYLLKCLNNYVSNYLKRRKSQKDRINHTAVSLDQFEDKHNLLVSKSASPEEAFNISWIRQIIADVISETKCYCHNNKKDVHWEVFNSLVLLPALNACDKPELSYLCQMYGVDDPKSISNMMITVKRVFKRIFYEKISMLVDDKSKVGQELQEMLNILK